MARSTLPPEPPSLLVRTPAPHHNESFYGYMLRLTQANGYRTPTQVYQVAGYPEEETLAISVRPEKLAMALGRPTEDLARIANCHTIERGSRRRPHKLLDHDMGYGFASPPIRSKFSAVCPECIAEDGYAEAWTDLKLALACPRHSCWLIEHCPHCKQALSRLRPGLLLCRCQKVIDSAAPASETAPFLPMMAFLRARAHGTEYDQSVLDRGYPMDAITRIPLAAFLAIVTRLGVMHFKSQGNRRKPDPRALVLHMDAVLANWPHSFNAMLERLHKRKKGEKSGANGLFNRMTLLKTHPLTKGSQYGHSGFVRKAMANFAMNYNQILAHTTLLNASDQDTRRFVSMTEYCQLTDALVPQVRRQILSGKLPAVRVKGAKKTTYIIDIIVNPPRPRTPGRAVSIDAAAKQLGIGVRQLVHARKIGLFESSAFFTGAPRLHEADLSAFCDRFLTCAATSSWAPSVNDEAEELGRALRVRHFFGTEEKVQILADVLSGAVRCERGTYQTIGSLRVSSNDLAAVRRRAALKAYGGRVSLNLAAQIIGCKAAAAAGLVRSGILKIKRGPEKSHLVRLEDVEAFRERYTDFYSLRHKFGTKSQHLYRWATELGFSLLAVRDAVDRRWLFIERTQLPKLEKAIERRMQSRGRSN